MITQRRLRRRLALLLLLAAAVAGWYVPTGYLLVGPGQTMALAQRITTGDEALPPAAGDVLLLTVQARPANPYQVVLAFGRLLGGRSIVHRRAVVPPRLDDHEYLALSRAQMEESVGLAAVAALQAAGLAANGRAGGARVVTPPMPPPWLPPTGRRAGSNPSPGSPLDLRPGDVITRANGADIGFTGDLAPALRDLGPGNRVQLEVERDGRRQPAEASLGWAPPGGQEVMLGTVLLSEDPVFDLSVPLAVDTGNVIGPSGGLALALAFYQSLGHEDVLRGRSVAASGYIRLDGTVGPVGGIGHKAAAAAAAGCDLLLVPPANYAEARAAAPELDIAATSSLAEALRFLRTGGLTLP